MKMVAYPGGSVKLEATFKDEEGNLYEPDSQTLEFYDPSDVLIASKTQADCTHVGLGVWSIEYALEETAAVGRWLCHWTTKVGSKYYPQNFIFIVSEKSAPTVGDVRAYLANICEERIGDDTIAIQLRLASRYCGRYCSSTAENDDVNDAVLTRAGWMAYIAYLTVYERSIGQVPPAMLGHSAVLEGLALEAMLACGATIDARKAGPISSFTPTMVPESYEKDAQGRG
jgi:hypothetical protein